MKTSITPFLLLKLLVVGILLLLMSLPSSAQIKVCNDTKNLVGVAVGYRNQGRWITEGWWRIPSNLCESVIEGDLTSRYYYLYSEDAVTNQKWDGPILMCISSRQFKINGLQDCYARGYEKIGFFEVDTGDQTFWRVRLTDRINLNRKK
ncbi:DUF1036 domain-containing protein [Candidatus Endowatersipora endosymbiont of Watersipora subatra]|uniref:DUF1036 domain-containing protein n=1 Tax=Candidatus Endowatersipora endosymbiont of Watersipora subatra TaxID=3077946 RepID=UPI00312C6DF9